MGNKPYFGSDEKQLVDTWDQTDPRKEKRSMYAYIAFIPSVGRSLCKALAVRSKKNKYRTSSVVMAGAVVIAIVTFGANGFGGSGRNAMAAPRIQESAEEPEEPEEPDNPGTEDPEKADAVFRVMQSARSVKDSRKIMEHLSDPAVEKVFSLSRQVGNEHIVFWNLCVSGN